MRQILSATAKGHFRSHRPLLPKLASGIRHFPDQVRRRNKRAL
jgi:hypothetical protein